MTDLSQRIGFIIEAKGMTKTAFAERLNVSQAFVSQLCSGAKQPSDRTISDICREFDVREEWLKTGDGEPFKKMSPEEEVASYVSDLLEDDTENPLYEIIKEIMRTYSELSPKSQEVIRDFSQRLMDNIKKRKLTPPFSVQMLYDYDAELTQELIV